MADHMVDIGRIVNWNHSEILEKRKINKKLPHQRNFADKRTTP